MATNPAASPGLKAPQQLKRYAIYAGMFRARRDLRDGLGDLRATKAERLDGRRTVVMAAWRMNQDDPYPGEWAMTFEPRYFGDDPVVQEPGLGWVASGDFEGLEYLGMYGCPVPATATAAHVR
jgi:hypothetical protein